MPTSKPRINLTVPKHLNDTLGRIADLQGVSRGAVVVDLLEGVHPALMKMCMLMEAAANASDQIKGGLSDTISDVGDAVAQIEGLTSDQFDLLIDAFSPSQGSGEDAPRSPAEGGLDPHFVIRGSGQNETIENSAPTGSSKLGNTSGGKH